MSNAYWFNVIYCDSWSITHTLTCRESYASRRLLLTVLDDKYNHAESECGRFLSLTGRSIVFFPGVYDRDVKIYKYYCVFVSIPNERIELVEPFAHSHE